MFSFIEYVTEIDGKEYTKWFASVHYKDICENLITLMKGGHGKVNDYGVPFIISLVAALESNLNDWLIVDTFTKHGPKNYENIVNGYMTISIKNKFRSVISIMTDNHMQIKEESLIVKDLDELIVVRNKIVHAKPRFYTKVSKHAHKPKKQKPEDHPLQTLKISDCRRYLKAVRDYEKLFFRHVDKGFVKENKLVRKIESRTKGV